MSPSGESFFIWFWCLTKLSELLRCQVECWIRRWLCIQHFHRCCSRHRIFLSTWKWQISCLHKFAHPGLRCRREISRSQRWKTGPFFYLFLFFLLFFVSPLSSKSLRDDSACGASVASWSRAGNTIPFKKNYQKILHRFFFILESRFVLLR